MTEKLNDASNSENVVKGHLQMQFTTKISNF